MYGLVYIRQKNLILACETIYAPDFIFSIASFLRL